MLFFVGILVDLMMLTVGPLLTNCYVVWCAQTREAAIIDPGFDSEDDAEKILGFVRQKELNLRFVVDTHGHPDHTCGNGMVKDATGASILIHESDADMLGVAGARLAAFFRIRIVSPAADGFLVDGNTVRFGRGGLRVLHTPGHSPGSVCLIGDNCVFSGDTLFAGSVGRVDLPGGSGAKLLRSLRNRLMGLADGFVVYPGHGPESTIGEEKRCNPFMQENFDASLFG